MKCRGSPAADEQSQLSAFDNCRTKMETVLLKMIRDSKRNSAQTSIETSVRLTNEKENLPDEEFAGGYAKS